MEAYRNRKHFEHCGLWCPQGNMLLLPFFFAFIFLKYIQYTYRNNVVNFVALFLYSVTGLLRSKIHIFTTTTKNDDTIVYALLQVVSFRSALTSLHIHFMLSRQRWCYHGCIIFFVFFFMNFLFIFFQHAASKNAWNRDRGVERWFKIKSHIYFIPLLYSLTGEQRQEEGGRRLGRKNRKA